MRPYVTVYLAISLDQYIAREEGGLDWLDAMHVPGEDYGYAVFMAGIDTLVLGRNTYDTVRGFGEWPYPNKRVIVMSSREIVPLAGEERAEGLLSVLLDRLAKEGCARVYLDGGQLVRQGLAEGVVDRLILSVIPVLLGKGRPLFGAGLAERALRLASARSFATGLVQLEYQLERAGVAGGEQAG